MERRHFDTLDSWRGIAATLVVLHHTFAYSHVFSLPLLRNGWWCVDFFFVLSGFVISYAYAGRLGSWGELRSFTLQRFGRIYPLHFFMLFVLVLTECAKVLVGHLGIYFQGTPFTNQTSLFALCTNLLLIHSFGFHVATAGSWNVPSWSIGVEFYTYLIFAFLVFRLKRPQIAFAGLILLSIGVLCTSPFYLGEGFGLGIFRCLYGFLMGHFVWLAWSSFGKQQALREKIARYSAPLEIGMIVLVVVAMSYTGFEPSNLALPLIFALTVFIFTFEAGPLSRLLKTPPFLFIGKLSYSIYMTHFWVLWCVTILLDKLAPRFLHTVLTMVIDGVTYLGTSRWMGDAITLAIVAIVIGVSTFTYYFVELPGRNYFRKLAKALEAEKPSALAAGQGLRQDI